MLNRLNNEELKQIAIDIRAGRIFSNWHIPDNEPDMLYSIFMPLGLMNADQMEEIATANIGLVYEYMNQAGPMAINGYPMFMSFHVLHLNDAKVVLEFINRLEAAESTV